jgi:hypothetical protein
MAHPTIQPRSGDTLYSPARSAGKKNEKTRQPRRGETRVSEDLCRPSGARIVCVRYPALRAGLQSVAPLRGWESTARKRIEYMHRNPATRGLVENPEDWK